MPLQDSVVGESAEKNPKAKKLFHWIRDDVCKAIKEKVLKKVAPHGPPLLSSCLLPLHF
jgi:hypothetical protein